MKTLKFYNTIALLFIVLTAFQCADKLDDNVRVQIKGLVVDQNNNPIPNAKIRLTARRGNGFSVGQSTFVMGEFYSQSDGSISAISLYDANSDFAIEVDAGDDYSVYVYSSDTRDFPPQNLTFDLGTITLKQKATLNYNFNRTSGNGNTLTYSILYDAIGCFETYQGTTLIEEQSFCFYQDYTNRTLDDNTPDFNATIPVFLGSTVQITYSINNAPNTTETLTINQLQNEFTLNY